MPMICQWVNACMCMRVCVCVRVCQCVREMCVYNIVSLTYICTHLTHTYTHIYMYSHTSLLLVDSRTCIYRYLYINTRTHTYIYLYTHTSLLLVDSRRCIYFYIYAHISHTHMHRLVMHISKNSWTTVLWTQWVSESPSPSQCLADWAQWLKTYDMMEWVTESQWLTVLHTALCLHCTLHCVLHCTLHCIAHYIVQCRVSVHIMQCALQLHTMQCAMQCVGLSDSLTCDMTLTCHMTLTHVSNIGRLGATVTEGGDAHLHKQLDYNSIGDTYVQVDSLWIHSEVRICVYVYTNIQTYNKF